MQSGAVHILKSPNAEGVFAKTTRCSSPRSVTTACTNLRTSENGKWLVVHYYQHDVSVFSLEKDELHARIPRGFLDSSEPSTFEFYSNDTEVKIVIVCDNNKFYM